MATKKKAPAKRAAAKKANGTKTNGEKQPGIIATIKEHLESKSGATKSEILEALVALFPKRPRDGMATTVGIQCNRLATTTGRAIITKDVEGRGRVFKFEDCGAIPGKEVVKEEAKA